MKKNLTKIMMLALTLCMMIAMFAVVASADEPTTTVVALENTTVAYTGRNQMPVIHVYENSAWTTADWNNVKVNGVAYDEETCKFTEAGLYLLEVSVDGKVYTLRYEITKITPVLTLGGSNTAKNLTYTGEKAKGFWSGTSSYIDVNRKSVSLGSKAEKAVITMTYYVASEYAADPATAQPVTPVDVGTYTIVMTSAETNNLKAAKKVMANAIKISPKTITMTIEDAFKEYGKADPEDYKNKVDGLIEGDEVKFDFTREEGEVCYVRFGDMYKITPAIVGGADKDNYKLEWNDAYLIIKQRVLTAADFDVETLVYNGKLQLPEVEVKETSLGEEGCRVETVGSARKYGGTYYITVVGFDNDSYSLGNDVTEIRLEYTIVAEGEKDSDNAVKDFVEGVVNAGQAAGAVIETVAPVFNYVGNAIWSGIKFGVSALVNDFFGRVFG